MSCARCGSHGVTDGMPFICHQCRAIIMDHIAVLVSWMPSPARASRCREFLEAAIFEYMNPDRPDPNIEGHIPHYGTGGNR